MPGQIELLVPVGETLGQKKSTIAPRLKDLKGCSVAVFSNSWQCMTSIADELQIVLTGPAFGAREVVYYETPTTHRMPENLMREAIARSDAAIVGLGT